MKKVVVVGFTHRFVDERPQSLFLVYFNRLWEYSRSIVGHPVNIADHVH